MLLKLPFEIVNETPVLFATQAGDSALTATRDFFTGAVVRGALAQRMIQKKRLGAQAHLDADFSRLFLSGAVRFLPAYPKTAAGVSRPLPLSLYQDKSGGAVQDLLFAAQYPPGYKAVKGLGVMTASGSVWEIEKAEVEKELFFHHARGTAKERIAARSLEGKVFCYEAMRAGQSFAGSMLGEEADLTRLLAQLQLDGRQMEAWFGRSRYAQYGKCRVFFQELEAADTLQELEGERVYLRCETPYLPYQNSGNTRGALLEILSFLQESCPASGFALLEPDEDGGKIFAAWEEVDQFVGAWGLKRPREHALCAGSVFGFRKASARWTEKEISALKACLYGAASKRAVEGFGQLRVWPRRAEWRFAAKRMEAPAPQKVECSAEVRRVARDIVMKSVLEAARNCAKEAVDAIDAAQLVGKKHLFTRLENALQDWRETKGTKEAFAKKIQTDMPETQIASEHLQAIHCGQKNLRELLTDSKALPYVSALRLETLPPKMRELAQELAISFQNDEDNAVFYEYWRWFFRHARKQSRREEK